VPDAAIPRPGDEFEAPYYINPATKIVRMKAGLDSAQYRAIFANMAWHMNEKCDSNSFTMEGPLAHFLGVNANVPVVEANIATVLSEIYYQETTSNGNFEVNRLLSDGIANSRQLGISSWEITFATDIAAKYTTVLNTRAQLIHNGEDPFDPVTHPCNIAKTQGFVEFRPEHRVLAAMVQCKVSSDQDNFVPGTLGLGAFDSSTLPMPVVPALE
jgi:hypothetical protein